MWQRENSRRKPPGNKVRPLTNETAAHGGSQFKSYKLTKMTFCHAQYIGYEVENMDVPLLSHVHEICQCIRPLGDK